MSLKSDLDKFAETLLSDALKPDVKFEARIDVFRAVVVYHLGAQKAQPKGAPAHDDPPLTFSDLTKQLNGSSTKGGTA